MAAHNRCREFTVQAAVETSELLDGHKFQGSEPKGAVFNQRLEFSYGHLVQAAGNLAESRCPVRFKGGSPTNQGFLIEY